MTEEGYGIYETTTGGSYRDMWVFCESRDGELLDVSLEMISKARRLMDAYNETYDTDENVVTVILGKNAPTLGAECLEYGADIAYVAEHDELEPFRLRPYTTTVKRAAQLNDDYKDYDEPRYFLFPATHNGRDLSATIAGCLDTGLASDCDELYIEDVDIKHPFKTGGEEHVFERVLHMVRPDFSGFEHSTILCLDNQDRDFHPQCCSVIPASFEIGEADPQRAQQGRILQIPVEFEDGDLDVVVKETRSLDEGVDLSEKPRIVALGRGIGDDPTEGIKTGVNLARAMDADLGLSRGVITASYQVDATVEQFVTEERQIGETGQFVEPDVYIAAGISGAIQHKVGMDDSEFIVTVNTDPEAPIKDFSDVFVEGDLFEVLPTLTQLIEKIRGEGE